MGQPADTEIKTKLVVVGDTYCGKTKFVNRYVNSTYEDTYTATGIDTYHTTYQVSAAHKIHVSIWDTSGDQSYDRVRPVSYADADLVLVCYSIEKPETLHHIATKWLPEIKEHCPHQPIIVVGCGSDMRTDGDVLARLSANGQSPVTYDQGLKAAKDIEALVYSETSAKTSERSVKDILEVAILSSVGGGAKYNCSDARFKRQRSFIKRKKCSWIGEPLTTVRAEATKSCVIM